MTNQTFEIDNEEEITEIVKLDAALDLLNTSNANMEAMFVSLHDIIETAKVTLVQLETEKDALEKIKTQQEEEISGLNQGQLQLLKEYEQVKVELAKFTGADGSKDLKFDEMKATLSIYSVLISEIWQSQPHYKVLKLLHGDAEEMHLDKLKGASGISGAMILRACHELKNAELIEFDTETKMVKLVKRFF